MKFNYEIYLKRGFLFIIISCCLLKQTVHGQESLQEARRAWLEIAQKDFNSNQLPEALKRYEALITLMPDDEEAKKGKTLTLIAFARNAAQQGKNQEAATYFQKAIENDPSKRLELLRELADQLSYLGKADEGVPLYQEFLASHPSEEEAKQARQGLARAFIWMGKYAEALKEYQSILELLKNQSSLQEALSAWLGIARSYFLNGQLVEALHEYEALLTLMPKDEDAKNGKIQTLIQLAQNAAQKGNNQEAVNYFQQVIEIAPSKRQEILPQFADQLSYSGQANKAIPLYQELLSSSLSSEQKLQIRQNLARAFMWTGQYQEALKEYDLLLKLNPHHSETEKGKIQTLLELARESAKQGKNQEALDAFQKVIEGDPNKRLEILREFADQLSYLGRANEAIPLYREILNAKPSLQEAKQTHQSLARALTWVGEYSEALKEYQMLSHFDPSDKEMKKGQVEALIAAARDAAKKGKNKEAVAYFQQAIEADPNRRRELLRELADQLSYSGQANDAIPLYKEILASHPSEEETKQAHQGLAQAFIWIENYQNALEQYHKLLQLDPNQVEAKKGITQALIKLAREAAQHQKNKESADYFQQAIESDPNQRLELLREFADQLSYSKRAEEAIPLYREFLASNPLSEEEMKKAYLGLARALNWTNHYRESLEVYDFLLALDSNQADARKERSEVLDKYTDQLFKQGMEEEKNLLIFKAKSLFQRVVSLSPNNKGYWEHYAWFLHNYGFLDEAVEAFYELAPRADDARPVYQVLGWDLKTLGKLRESLFAFQHAFKIDPYTDNLNSAFIVINDEQKKENLQKVHCLEKELSCEDNEDNLETKKKLFDNYTYVGYTKHAIALGRQIVDEDPTDNFFHFKYANTLFQARRKKAAIREYQALLFKVPDSAYVYWKLGEVYEKAGCLNQAQFALQTAREFDSDPHIQRALARVLAKLGNFSEAISTSYEIPCDEKTYLTNQLSLGEVNLFSGYYRNASDYYRGVLEDYPYHQEALWGLLKSSSITRRHADARLSYNRWKVVHFNDSLQEQLADYYRPTEVSLIGEYFDNILGFRRKSVQLSYDDYAFNDIRYDVGYYFTKFSQSPFIPIYRQSIFLEASKLFSDNFQMHVRLVENAYHRIFPSTSPDYTSMDMPIHRDPMIPFHMELEDSSQEEMDPVADATTPVTSVIPSPSTEEMERDIITIRPKKMRPRLSFNYFIDLKYKITPQIIAGIGYAYYDIIDTEPPFGNPIYNYSNQIGAATLNIKTKDINAFLFCNLGERFYLFGRIIYGKYSDDNLKRSRVFRFNYLILPLFNLNISYDYFYLDFAHAAPVFSEHLTFESVYYDPKNFEVHTINLRSEYQFTRHFQLGVETAILYLPKCRNIGNSLFIYFDYRLTCRLSCRLDLRYFHQNRSVLRTGLGPSYEAKNATLLLRYVY